MNMLARLALAWAFIGGLMPTTGHAQEYRYQLTWLAPATHTYVIEATVSPQTGTHTDLAMPIWRPGRYFRQDYAAAVSHFEAVDAQGRSLAWTKVNAHTWRVSHRNDQPLTVRYHVYASNMDAGSSYLGQGQAYFNPVNLFMYVPGRLDAPVRLHLPMLPADWKAATALQPTADPQVYTADSYHTFVDAPTVFAREMKQLQFSLDGVTFYLHFQGSYAGGAETDSAAVDAVRRICQEQGAIFGGFPFDAFHFIYRLLPYQLRHAVEHANSASFALPTTVADGPTQIVNGIASITAHEFFHAWNVKRIRPAALWPYDYGQPQYTRLHWFTEGVTDYYAHLTMVRTGLWSENQFLRQQARVIGSLENSYAASVVSPAQASYDSWLEVSDYAHPDHRISYYPLGTRLGLLMDLRLRTLTAGEASLDDLFRYLYQTWYLQGRGVPEDGIQSALETLSGTSWADWFAQYVEGTGPFDEVYASTLGPVGLTLEVEAGETDGLRGLGFMRVESTSQGWLVQRVHPGGDAAAVGFGPGDLILEIDGQQASGLDPQTYLADLTLGQTLRMRVFSDFQVQERRLTYAGKFAPRDFSLVKQIPAKPAARQRLADWLASKS